MGIDIGGTFTDVVLSGPTRIGPFLTKTLTTPDALGQEVSAENFPERKAAASFDDFPLFHAAWSDGKAPPLPPDYRVAIIGSGNSGVAMGVQLNLLGIPYDIYERRSDAGGVRINRYPDIRVDMMSCMYQAGFAKRYAALV
jgi:4-hydroxyacetophenone monooxygenase